MATLSAIAQRGGRPGFPERDGMQFPIINGVVRVAIPASAMRPWSPSNQIAAFARCLADDRDAIVRVAAR